jgi:thiosulfate/3-mercaptopyruvate sulfurtransferase
MALRSACFFTLALTVALSSGAPAATPRETLLVSTSWLAQHLHDPNLVLLHVGQKAEYDAEHIPGARFAEMHDVAGAPSGGLTLEMPPADVLREHLAALGISDDSHIVVYYGKDWVSPTTRIIFTLDYAGLDRVSLLDGGMGAWVKDGHDVTTDVPPARTGTLSPLKTRPLVVDADFVRSHTSAPSYAVVDGRAAVFYDGVQERGPKDHRAAGHIAGAHSVPFESVFTDDVRLKSAEDLTAIFSKADVKPGDTVIGYCHIGQQATAMLFAARTLGHHVLLYDGSFEDWARRELPIENPSKKDK